MPLLAEEEEGIIRKPAVRRDDLKNPIRRAAPIDASDASDASVVGRLTNDNIQVRQKPRMFDELGHEPVKSADVRAEESARIASTSLKAVISLRHDVELLLLEAKEKGYLDEIDAETSIRKVPRPRHRRQTEISNDTDDHLARLKYQPLGTKIAESNFSKFDEILDLCETRGRHRNYIEHLKRTIQDPHVQTIFSRVETACLALNRPDLYFEFALSVPQIRLSAAQDVYFDQVLLKDDPTELKTERTKGINIGDTVYIRESRMRDKQYLEEIIKHEDYHSYTKIPYDLHGIPKVEGFNEIMKYQDILNDPSVSDDIKREASMLEGDYRVFAAQQYLVREIIGEDHFIVGHMVKGEGYLRAEFDATIGNGEYDKIFYGGLSEEEKIEALKGVVKTKFKNNPNTINRIFMNEKMIREKGRYNVE